MTTPFRPLRSAGYALLAGLFLLPAINAEAAFNLPVLPGNTISMDTNGEFGNGHFTLKQTHKNDITIAGGEFKMSLGNDTAVVFCLELTEHISNGSFFVSDVSDVVVFGGEPIGGNAVRALNDKTSWLYYQYSLGAQGALGALGSQTNALADAVQAHIWKQQGFTENSGVHAVKKSPTNAYTVAYNLIEDLLSAETDFSVTGNFAAINLWDTAVKAVVEDWWYDKFGVNYSWSNNSFSDDVQEYASLANLVGQYSKQSMIVGVPEIPTTTPNPIPEPSTIAVWSLAMFGLVVAGRRRLKARVA